MKKILSILSLLLIILLVSFSKKDLHPSTKPITKEWTCPTPTGLTAVKNGSQVTLSWTCNPPTPCSYGGYYNCPTCNPQTVTFGGSTNTWPIAIPIASGAISIRYSVTSNCADGSHGYSAPVFIYF